MLLSLAGLAYALMNNGWMYTFYPVHAMVLMSMYYVWREYGWLKANAGAKACVLVFALHIVTIAAYMEVLLPHIPPSERTMEQQCIAEFSEALKTSGSTNFGTISLSASLWPQLARATAAQMDTRFYTLWILPSFMNSDAAYKQKNMWVLNYVAHALTQDIVTNKPGIIIEEIATPSRKTLDLRNWFAHDPAFTAAGGAYEKMDLAESHNASVKCPYIVYQRKVK